FFVSLTIPVVLTTANGLLQILAPPDMRGRVLSIFLMISFGAQPIAAILIGVAADLFTPMGAVLLNGALMVVAAGVLVGLRSGLLSWEARPAMPAPARPRTRRRSSHLQLTTGSSTGPLHRSGGQRAQPALR